MMPCFWFAIILREQASFCPKSNKFSKSHEMQLLFDALDANFLIKT